MKRSTIVLLLVTALLVAHGALPSAAATPLGEDVSSVAAQGHALGPDRLVSVAESDQELPAVAYNSVANEWLVVWQDSRAGSHDIYGQRVGGQGNGKEGTFIVQESANGLHDPAVAYNSLQRRYFVVWSNTTTRRLEGRVLDENGASISGLVNMPADVIVPNVARTHPAVVYNRVSGEWLVVWEYETAADNLDIQGCRVGPDGTVNAAGVLGIGTAMGHDRDPIVVADPDDGRYLVVWSRDPGDGYNAVGRRLLSNGTADSAIFRISSADATGDESRPAAALNPATHQVLVTWWDTRADLGDIYGRLVSADNTRGPEFSVQVAAGRQASPAVAFNPTDQQYLVVWDTDGTINLYGHRLDAAGAVQDAPFPIAGEGSLAFFGAVAFGASSYLVAWNDHRTGMYDVYGRRVGRAGELLADEVNLSPALNWRDAPALAFGPVAGEFLVVWADMRAGLLWDVFGQRVARDGTLSGQPILISNANGIQVSPDVAYNPDSDEFLVVWCDTRNSHQDIYGQRVGPDGVLRGAPIRYTSDLDDQAQPAVVYNAAGHQYLVVWEDSRDDDGSGTNRNIYGRLAGQGGSPTGSDLALCSLALGQMDPDVAFDPVTHTYLVVWEDTAYGIRGQRVNEGGGLAGNVVNVSYGWREAPSIACNSALGQYLVVWRDGRDHDTAGYDIYGRRLASDGAPLDANDVPISTAQGDQMWPSVSYGPALARYYVAWDDDRYGDVGPDIFGQTLSAAGAPLFSDPATNVSVLTYAGEQRYPAVAVDPADDTPLWVWVDERAGSAAGQIYGLAGTPTGIRVFLPAVLKRR